MIVAQILASKGRDVVSTSPERTIADVARELASRRIGALVVTERGRLIGIVSERDIVKALGLNGPEILGDPVASIMTRDVVTCRERDKINTVMGRMTERRFRHLPVVEEGDLVGIVSIGDVVKARIEQVEFEADELRTYIATA
ncbi:MAG: CBS domain-containing protein [Rhizobiales bacterium]|nr:CBS domain-containing protein [Hyphomicrobiales bacterium]